MNQDQIRSALHKLHTGHHVQLGPDVSLIREQVNGIVINDTYGEESCFRHDTDEAARYLLDLEYDRRTTADPIDWTELQQFA